MSKPSAEVRKLNRKILNQVETELEVLKKQKPEVADDIDAMRERLRKNILDILGDCVRGLEECE